MHEAAPTKTPAASHIFVNEPGVILIPVYALYSFVLTIRLQAHGIRPVNSKGLANIICANHQLAM
jgi:hypothetical protein